MRATAVVVALLATGSCGGTEETPLCEVRTSLVDHTLWVPVPAESDPFRAEGEECDLDHMRAEDLTGEVSWTIETRGCRWGTVEQPVPFRVAAGDFVNYRLWYFSQTNFDAAEATLIVAVGDEPLWTRKVPLPASIGGLTYSSEPAPRDLEPGEMLRFHVENHGTNSWNLIEVTVSRMEPCAE